MRNILFKMAATKLTGLALLAFLVLASVQTHAAKANASAPDFTLASNQGKNLRLKEQRGEVIMINFWASWCGPCRQEMPFLDELHQRYSKAGFQIWGVNMDADKADAEHMLKKIPVSFPILFDPEGKVGSAYNVEAMPSSIFIDREGKIRHIHKGYRPGEEATYKKYIKELIRE